jgi:predicted AlkP superfamily pyrophosphatase or phosphodiesterase
MFWWYNMYANVNCSVTPRPSYPADGRKLFDSYSEPADLKDDLQQQLGVFPLLKFWGPGAGIESSAWIADATTLVIDRQRPSLTLVYLPHLDYNLQRLGPDDTRCRADIRAVDAEAGKLIAAARRQGADVVVLSEYGITAVDRPIHINRLLREHGYLSVRKEITGWETLDCGASRAFAVADHQLAHIYVQRPDDIQAVADILRRCDGIEHVLCREAQAAFGIDHERAGDLVVVADRQSWFTYYFWLDDALAPDYARTVDIHRKPGYDPVELFLDPVIRFPKLKVASRLARKVAGFRYLMDVIGLDASIVRGSHGRLPDPGREATDGPVFICSSRAIEADDWPMTAVRDRLLTLQFGNDPRK